MPPLPLQPWLPWEKDSQGSVTLLKTCVFPITLYNFACVISQKVGSSKIEVAGFLAGDCLLMRTLHDDKMSIKNDAFWYNTWTHSNIYNKGGQVINYNILHFNLILT